MSNMVLRRVSFGMINSPVKSLAIEYVNRNAADVILCTKGVAWKSDDITGDMVYLTAN